MVRSIFIEEDNNHIIQLRVSARGEDELKWILESSGVFMVSSAYHAKNIVCYSGEEAQSWQILWTSIIHYRLKVTLWRFTRGVLPTRMRLRQFANIYDPKCLLCNRENEDELHLMARCEIMRLMWFHVLGIHLNQVQFNTPLEFLNAVLQINHFVLSPSASAETKLRVVASTAIIVRRIWEAPNDLLFEEIALNVEALAILIESNLAIEMARIDGPQHQPLTSFPPHWISPPLGCLKVNVEATWRDGQTGLAAIDRDELGMVQGFWFHIWTTNSVQEVEVLAILRACQAIHGLGYSKIMIESDCKLVVDVVLEFSTVPWKISSIVEDIKAASTCFFVL